MITLPEHVLQADEGEVGFSWDGTSPHPDREGEMVPNKETSMNWAEHQRIVCSARGLLASWTPDKHAGDGKKAFGALKDAYEGNKGRSCLRVSKGIHQPEANPHLQLRVVEEFGKGQAAHYTFHLAVSATEITGVSGLDHRFRWDAAQFSYETANWRYCWPVLPVPPRRKNETPSRRNSISYASLDAYTTALAEKEKQQKHLDALENLKEAIEQDLVRLEKEEGMMLRKLKNEPPANFWKGKTKTFVVDRYRKGYYVIWDEKTKKLVQTV